MFITIMENDLMYKANELNNLVKCYIKKEKDPF